MSRNGPPRGYRAYSGRTVALWLLYALVGGLLAIMLLAGGGDMTGDQSRSPTRLRTKVVGAASGMALALAGLGWYLLSDPRAARVPALLLLGIGAPLGIVIALWACAWIAADLNRRGVGRRR